ncbi:MAG: hypothetical protein U0T83_08375 [Bacteriovoracaceae bacterium]
MVTADQVVLVETVVQVVVITVEMVTVVDVQMVEMVQDLLRLQLIQVLVKLVVMRESVMMFQNKRATYNHILKHSIVKMDSMVQVAVMDQMDLTDL